ncbi:MAG TPA: cupin domain-containing protein [Candidatus Binataceae bacterium]|nr:cupin domain-containing protein [Candidatus Binataceae bacterium]
MQNYLHYFWTAMEVFVYPLAMSTSDSPIAVEAAAVPPRSKPSNYPAPFASRMAGRTKRVLGDIFELKNFGVNLTRLSPGAQSALHHRHSAQDEFIYVLEGEPTLITDSREIAMCPGMCAGFAAGGAAHHLVNRSDRDVVYLEIGDRSRGDSAYYPDDDIQAVMNADGSWHFAHKNGTAY